MTKRIFHYFIKTANERREDTVKMKEIVRPFAEKNKFINRWRFL